MGQLPTPEQAPAHVSDTPPPTAPQNELQRQTRIQEQVEGQGQGQGAVTPEATPLLAGGGGATSSFGADTWRFNMVDRPARDMSWAVLLVLVSLAAAARQIEFIEFDPASSALAPLERTFPRLLLRLLLPLALGAMLAYQGCRMLLTWTKGASRRVLRWMLLAFAVLQVLAILVSSATTPTALPHPPFSVGWGLVAGPIASRHVSASDESAGVSLPRVQLREWPLDPLLPDPGLGIGEQGLLSEQAPDDGRLTRLKLRTSSSSSSSRKRPSLGGTGLEVGPSSRQEPSSGVRVLTAVVPVVYALAAVVVLARCFALLEGFAALISAAPGLLLRCCKPLPGLVTTLVASVSYFCIVLGLAVAALVAKSCQQHRSLVPTVSSPSVFSFPGAGLLGAGRQPVTALASALASLALAHQQPTVALVPGAPRQQCDDVINALVPTDTAGAALASLSAFTLLWLGFLGMAVLQFCGAFVVAEGHAFGRVEAEASELRDQWAVLLQGARLALKESLGSLCLAALLLTLGSSLLYTSVAGVALGLGFLSQAWAPLLVLLLQFGVTALIVFVMGLVVPLLATTGKPFWVASRKAWSLLRTSAAEALAFFITAQAVLEVCAAGVLALLAMGAGLLGAILARFQGTDIVVASAEVLSMVPSLCVAAFTSVLSSCIWSCFISQKLSPTFES